MIETLTIKQKTEMARFIFSILGSGHNCRITTGDQSPFGKCFMHTATLSNRKKPEVLECMAVATTKDGENAFGVTFDGEFIFFNKGNLIRGFPFIISG